MRWSSLMSSCFCFSCRNRLHLKKPIAPWSPRLSMRLIKFTALHVVATVSQIHSALQPLRRCCQVIKAFKRIKGEHCTLGDEVLVHDVLYLFTLAHVYSAPEQQSFRGKWPSLWKDVQSATMHLQVRKYQKRTSNKTAESRCLTIPGQGKADETESRPTSLWLLDPAVRAFESCL